MTYHISGEQYDRAVNYIAATRLGAVGVEQHAPLAARILGMADLIAHLGSVSVSRVMRDSDARLADLDSPLSPLPPPAGELRLGDARDVRISLLEP